MDSTTNIIANCLAQRPPTEIIQCSMERYTLVFYKNYMPHFWSKPKGDEENCWRKLPEFEYNLIAPNLKFQYMDCLKICKWATTKNQLISVPVSPETVLNTVQIINRFFFFEMCNRKRNFFLVAHSHYNSQKVPFSDIPPTPTLT